MTHHPNSSAPRTDAHDTPQEADRSAGVSREADRDVDGLRARLTEEQFRITQHKGTERAFTGRYLHNKASGVYACVVCGADLFASDTKYDSGSGWPSFWLPLAGDRVATHRDSSHGMVRTEVTCARCGAHLGHVFDDGPQPTGLRYCVNSASLDFHAKDDGDPMNDTEARS